jgi:hypothetical protein
MYEEFVERLLFWIHTLNVAEKQIEKEEVGVHPYLGEIPVMLENEVIGHLVDRIGGVWSYEAKGESDASEAE